MCLCVCVYESMCLCDCVFLLLCNYIYCMWACKLGYAKVQLCKEEDKSKSISIHSSQPKKCTKAVTSRFTTKEYQIITVIFTPILYVLMYVSENLNLI